MSQILVCKDLSKRYGHTVALDHINLSLESGRIIGLLGPNGSGKTTLIKLINGLLSPNSGTLLVNGMAPGVETKKIVSYLPERTYLDESQRISDAVRFFEDFYEDFDKERAFSMLEKLSIDPSRRIKTLSKGTKEKVQLILVMSRQAQLYLLDEPIAGVDPAAREYILGTIINNYNEDGTVIISTHLISDIERILDEVIFIREGKILCHEGVDEMKEREGKSVDEVFRDYFRMTAYQGYRDPERETRGKTVYNAGRKDFEKRGQKEEKKEVEKGGETNDR